MKLIGNGISNLETWKMLAPPMGGDKQWREGRSALELARYITTALPNIPKEIEDLFLNFTDINSAFKWNAEYVTDFSQFDLGRGEGRNHDAILIHPDIVAGIEAKADEPLGSQVIGEALKTASPNKMHRINGMIHMLFGDIPENHKNLRYQLITASAAMLLEAKKRSIQNALLIIIVFKKDGCYQTQNVHRNHIDIENFLDDISAISCGDYYLLPTHYGKEHGINLYFKYLEIFVN